jgi:uncharacterized membrane protein YhiD involved in acid resistance
MVRTYTLAAYLVLLISEGVHPKIFNWFELVRSAHHQETKKKTKKTKTNNQKQKMKRKTRKEHHTHTHMPKIKSLPVFPFAQL